MTAERFNGLTKHISLTIFYLTLFGGACAQEAQRMHPSLLGVSVIGNSFKVSGRGVARNTFDAGIGVNYLQSISRMLDLHVSLNGSFPVSVSDHDLTGTERRLLVQSDVAGRIHPSFREVKLQGYFKAGLGASYHTSSFGSYLLTGPGLQLKVKDVFFLLDAQYRKSISAKLNNHSYVSLGIAGTIGNSKKIRTKSLDLSVETVVSQDGDRDGDGISDATDSCVTAPGLARFQGCPDQDNDGIEDRVDLCPTVAGLERYRGCLVPDTDKDGINDESDSCLNIPGAPRYNGCPVPDADGDGVNDEEDSCIILAGQRINNGCPVIASPAEAISRAAKNILFETGSARLLPTSYPALDSIAISLKRDTRSRIIIEGHTDNTGLDAENLILSTSRAASVKHYLGLHGIDEKRLTSVGYGALRPTESNNTASGRRENRRVEIKVQ